MKKHKNKKSEHELGNSASEGIVGMLISLHTFPLESEEDLMAKKAAVKEIKKLGKTKKN